MIAKRPPWQLQEAKNKFSEVVRLAKSEGPQAVSVRGTVEAYVVSREEYARLTPKPTESLLDFFMRSPLWKSEIEIERHDQPWPDRPLFEDDHEAKDE